MKSKKAMFSWLYVPNTAGKMIPLALPRQCFSLYEITKVSEGYMRLGERFLGCPIMNDRGGNTPGLENEVMRLPHHLEQAS